MLGTIIALVLSFGIPVAGWIYSARQTGRRRAWIRAGVAVYTVAVSAFAVTLVMNPSVDSEVTPGEIVEIGGP